MPLPDLQTLTPLAQRSFADLPEPRLRQLLQSAIGHLHAFARETQLTHDEWRAALAFLHQAAAITDDRRSEFSLMSDVFGLSSLVDLLAIPEPGATPGSVLGPFHARGSPWKDSPVNLIGANAGQPVVLRGRVLDVEGRPLAGAVVDYWQNADNGMYWQQDEAQPTDNLRCQVKVGEDGRFVLATVKPRPYTIPTDGPVGALFQRAHRSPWRPAHMHVIVEAPGHRALVTELFPHDDPYLQTDAVFGVRQALVAAFRPEQDRATCEWLGTSSYEAVDFDFVLSRPG